MHTRGDTSTCRPCWARQEGQTIVAADRHVVAAGVPNQRVKQGLELNERLGLIDEDGIREPGVGAEPRQCPEGIDRVDHINERLQVWAMIDSNGAVTPHDVAWPFVRNQRGNTWQGKTVPNSPDEVRQLATRSFRERRHRGKRSEELRQAPHRLQALERARVILLISELSDESGHSSPRIRVAPRYQIQLDTLEQRPQRRRPRVFRNAGEKFQVKLPRPKWRRCSREDAAACLANEIESRAFSLD